jgi:hypothetical protein
MTGWESVAVDKTGTARAYQQCWVLIPVAEAE